MTWLAFWKDPISDNQYKYVWLAANSAFKASADQEKYEKARKLKVSWCLLLVSGFMWTSWACSNAQGGLCAAACLLKLWMALCYCCVGPVVGGQCIMMYMSVVDSTGVMFALAAVITRCYVWGTFMLCQELPCLSSARWCSTCIWLSGSRAGPRCWPKLLCSRLPCGVQHASGSVAVKLVPATGPSCCAVVCFVVFNMHLAG